MRAWANSPCDSIWLIKRSWCRVGSLLSTPRQITRHLEHLITWIRSPEPASPSYTKTVVKWGPLCSMLRQISKHLELHSLTLGVQADSPPHGENLGPGRRFPSSMARHTSGNLVVTHGILPQHYCLCLPIHIAPISSPWSWTGSSDHWAFHRSTHCLMQQGVSPSKKRSSIYPVALATFGSHP